MAEPVHKPNRAMDLQGAAQPPARRFIIIGIEDDGTPIVDHTGIDPWAAYAILFAAADELWDSLPTPSVRSLPPREGDRP